MKRKIYNDLLKWKEEIHAKPLIMLGVRQCGKTHIINEFCQNEYQNYIYVNLIKRNDIIDLYDSVLSSDEKFNRLKVLLDFDIEKDNTILFIDEIQESEKIITELKYFWEDHPKLRVICAGSLLGVRLKRFKSSFPVGKITFSYLYPMDFEEFLWANNEELLIDVIKDGYDNNRALGKALHNKALKYYYMYLMSGGMPESVKKIIATKGDYIKYDNSVLNDILSSYFDDMRRYVTNDAESLKVQRIYNSLPSQLNNLSSKFQYSLVDKDARSRDYATALDWLEASNLVLRAKMAKRAEIPLEGFIDVDTFKLFLSDVGILNTLLKISPMDIIKDNISLYKGIITENFVANQLVCNNFSLYYWKNDATAEIDFLLYTRDGIIPLEVKARENTQSKSLNIYREIYHPKYSIRLSTKDFAYDPKKQIKSVPLYAVFLIKP